MCFCKARIRKAFPCDVRVGGDVNAQVFYRIWNNSDTHSSWRSPPWRILSAVLYSDTGRTLEFSTKKWVSIPAQTPYINYFDYRLGTRNLYSKCSRDLISFKPKESLSFSRYPDESRSPTSALELSRLKPSLPDSLYFSLVV